jgi:hypothetical protein
MATDNSQRLIIVGGFGIVAQLAVYGLYTDNVAFYLDGYTTSLVQICVVALILGVVHRPLFHCYTSQTTVRQQIAGGMMVVSYFMLTASRLPIPPWPLIFAVFAGVQDERKRTILTRLFIALAIVIGTRMLVSDALATSRMGITFWDQADVPADTLLALYFIIGGVFTASLCILTQIRTGTMHTASLVMNSFMIGVPILGVLWALAWIPGVTTGSVRYGATDESDATGVAFYVAFAAFLKLIIMSTVIEFIKAGRVFDYLGMSAIAYMVFPLVTTGSNSGILPRTSIVGMILVLFGIIVAFFNILFGLPPVYEIPASRLDLSCPECNRTKTWFGFMHSPLYWCCRGRMPSQPHSAMDDDDAHQANDEDAYDMGGGPTSTKFDTAHHEHTLLGARAKSERVMFDIPSGTSLAAPNGQLSAI